jgi:hypothetical protein
VPAIQTVGNFPLTVSAAAPAHGSGSRSLRQLAAVALEASGDAAIRYNYVDANREIGLRGGKIRYHASAGTSFTAVLAGVKWTTDSTVTGHVTFSPNALTGHGTVRILGPGGTSLKCRLSWHGAKATIVAGGHHLRAPAP